MGIYTASLHDNLFDRIYKVITKYHKNYRDNLIIEIIVNLNNGNTAFPVCTYDISIKEPKNCNQTSEEYYKKLASDMADLIKSEFNKIASLIGSDNSNMTFIHDSGNCTLFRPSNVEYMYVKIHDKIF